MKTFIFHSTFGDVECRIEYIKSARLIQIYSKEYSDESEIDFDWIPFMTATTTPAGVIIPEGCVCIKDYSENTGILAALEELGVLEREYSFPYNLVQLHICTVKEEIEKYAA